MSQIKFKRLTPAARIPQFAHKGDAGADLFSDCNLVLHAGEYKVVKTGVAIVLPEGFEAQVRPRSGLAAKNGITVLNAPGTIDYGYLGEIGVVLINHGTEDVSIYIGHKIAQLVVSRLVQGLDFEETDELPTTERGTGGFGSTGA